MFERFKGNILTEEERKLRLLFLDEEIKENRVDKDMIPFLKRINRFPFIVTTQSCSGHGEDPSKGRHAHIDFRSALSEKDTINKILRPMSERFVDISISLMLEVNKLRYVIWLNNFKWKEQLEYFISILEQVERELNGS